MHHLDIVLSELARLGLEARGHSHFRRQAVALLVPVFFPDVAVFHGEPRTASSPSAAGTHLDEEPALAARADGRTVLLAPEQGRRFFLQLTGTVIPPISTLLVPSSLHDAPGAWLVLGRYFPAYGSADRDLADLVAPVLALGDSRLRAPEDAPCVSLSARERQILQYLCRGFRNAEIALALGTSAHTVRNQLWRLFRKLGVSTRSELVWRASSLVARAEPS